MAVPVDVKSLLDPEIAPAIEAFPAFQLSAEVARRHPVGDVPDGDRALRHGHAH